jgi:hypothetical protein
MSIKMNINKHLNLERSKIDIQRLHRGQKRLSGEDFAEHPKRVQKLLENCGIYDLPTHVASLYHDTIEDTSLKVEDLEKKTNPQIARIVDSLSKPQYHTSFCRAAEHLSKIGALCREDKQLGIRAIAIKIADRCDNIDTIHPFSIKKQKEYLEETEFKLLPLFQEAKKMRNVDISIDSLLERLHRVTDPIKKELCLKESLQDRFQLVNFSEVFGIGLESSHIYLKLLMIHNRGFSIDDLSLIFQQPVFQLEQHLNVLYNNELLHREDGFLQPIPLEMVGVRRTSYANELLKQIKYLLPSHAASKDSTSTTYTNWEGRRGVYVEILEEANKIFEPIWAIESSDCNYALGDSFFVPRYVEKRVSEEVIANVICPDTVEDRRYARNYNGRYTKVRHIKGLSVPECINVAGDLIMRFSSTEEWTVLERNAEKAKIIKKKIIKLWVKANGSNRIAII